MYGAIADTIDYYGIAVTIKRKAINYYGNPPALVQSGGSYAAGTYYFRANPAVGGVEKPLGSETRVDVPVNDKVILSLPNLGIDVRFNVYQSNRRDFLSPALVALDVAPGSYTITSYNPSSGAPEEGSSNPYVAATTIVGRCMKDLGIVEDRWLQVGVDSVDDSMFYFRPEDDVQEGDVITVGNQNYTVTFVTPFPVFDDSVEALEVRAQKARLQG